MTDLVYETFGYIENRSIFAPWSYTDLELFYIQLKKCGIMLNIQLKKCCVTLNIQLKKCNKTIYLFDCQYYV